MAAVIDLNGSEDPRDAIHRAVAALAAGQIVAIPTETVYGLAASALCPEAVDRLSQIRGATDQPLALAIKSADDALDYVPSMSRLALRLARRCWPGPVTMVLEDSHPDSVVVRLPEAVQRKVLINNRIGLRVPSNSVALQILRLSAGPLVLTSATRDPAASPVESGGQLSDLDDRIDLVIDDGPATYGQISTVIEVGDKDFVVLRQGAVAEETLRQLTHYLALVVCTGNTCRSPMGEAVLRQAVARKLQCSVAELESRGVAIKSCGVAAMPGGQPSLQSVEIMRGMGIDISAHSSTPVTDQLAHHADLILTMTSGHKRVLVSQWPDLETRTHLFHRGKQDICDPIGQSSEVYLQCANELVENAESWADHILAETGATPSGDKA